ncbi:MAG: efflux RND transporter periplasmic adaptor subunit [Polaromonas sp.]|uniref:efflux RND transporter periplasmic adaptor subunit n=1 Tax=Polaromonas sp. TaxID=1869339 RepID=UPI0017D53343|nr:efflux RND transporter periplasmic adaptor subunit [Polaromonas sp.]MBA3595724.1 efflux RND transporter periplasmic adaptor subunit [Polaromonas sp.]
MNKSKIKPVAIVLIAVIAVTAGAYAMFSSDSGKPAQPAAAAPKPALTVSAAQPEQTRLPIKLSANGNIVAWQEAVIGSESSGLRLTHVLVNVGDTVRAGQVLARFSGDSVRADVAQARASLVEAQATAADAAANAARARTLQNSGALSTQQINQYNTSEQTAKARVAAAQAVLDAQQVRGNNTQVLAPDSGMISARSATVGAVVGSGTELFRLIRGGRLEWRAEVTSNEIGRIRPGATALVTAASGEKVKGTVRMVAPTVDPLTRNALVYVDLPRTPSVKAGMYAQGEFELGSVNALTLPQQALVLRDGFSYAMRIEPDNKVVQVKLQTGRRLGDVVEIVQGAKPGERYVAAGAAFLADGDTVKLAAAAPAAPAASVETNKAPVPVNAALAATK